MERGSGVVARGNYLYRRDVQERREDDLREGRFAGRPCPPVQLESRRQYAAGDRLPRGRQDQRKGVEGAHPRRRGTEHVSAGTEATEERLSSPRLNRPSSQQRLSLFGAGTRPLWRRCREGRNGELSWPKFTKCAR